MMIWRHRAHERNAQDLINIFMKARDMVCELKETSYKQVAEKLIHDIE
jgi:hypothetical protein